MIHLISSQLLDKIKKIEKEATPILRLLEMTEMELDRVPLKGTKARDLFETLIEVRDDFTSNSNFGRSTDVFRDAANIYNALVNTFIDRYHPLMDELMDRKKEDFIYF